VPAVGVAEVVAVGGGGADGGAVGGVDGAFASHVVGVTLDHVAVGQVMQAHHAPLPIPSHPKLLVVAAVDHDQRIDLVRVDIFLNGSTSTNSRDVFRNQVRSRMNVHACFDVSIASDLLPNSSATQISIQEQETPPTCSSRWSGSLAARTSRLALDAVEAQICSANQNTPRSQRSTLTNIGAIHHKNGLHPSTLSPIAAFRVGARVLAVA